MMKCWRSGTSGRVPVYRPDPFRKIRHPAAFIPATEFRGYRYGYVYKRLNRKDFDAWREHLPEVWQQSLHESTFGYRPHYKSEDLCVYDVQLPRYPDSDGSVGLITGYTWWSADYLRLGLQQDLRYIPETASVFRHDDIAEIFNRYDKDGSFGLDANELQQVLREVGIKGLTWRNVGKTAPENGIDLATETELMVDADALSRLAKGLQGKHTLVLQSGGSAQRGELETGATQQFTKQVVEFTTINFSQEEWNAIGGLFEGLKLRAAHFIKVGDDYYQPIGEFEQLLENAARTGSYGLREGQDADEEAREKIDRDAREISLGRGMRYGDDLHLPLGRDAKEIIARYDRGGERDGVLQLHEFNQLVEDLRFLVKGTARSYDHDWGLFLKREGAPKNGHLQVPTGGH